MKEKWKNLRIDVTFTAVLAVLLGVLFVVWPGQITIFFSRILAAAVMIAGAVLFLGRITARPVSLWSVIGSGILFLVGPLAVPQPDHHRLDHSHCHRRVSAGARDPGCGDGGGAAAVRGAPMEGGRRAGSCQHPFRCDLHL